jgi:hypothetical protein
LVDTAAGASEFGCVVEVLDPGAQALHQVRVLFQRPSVPRATVASARHYCAPRSGERFFRSSESPSRRRARCRRWTRHDVVAVTQGTDPGTMPFSVKT